MKRRNFLTGLAAGAGAIPAAVFADKLAEAFAKAPPADALIPVGEAPQVVDLPGPSARPVSTHGLQLLIDGEPLPMVTSIETHHHAEIDTTEWQSGAKHYVAALANPKIKIAYYVTPDCKVNELLFDSRKLDKPLRVELVNHDAGTVMQANAYVLDARITAYPGENMEGLAVLRVIDAVQMA